MKERKIIVNKCDVSGCEFYCRYTDNCLDYKHWYDKPLCKNLPDCHYKQLKRKEQECEELKGIRDRNFLHALEEQKRADKLSKTLTEIKEIAEEKANVNDWLALEILQKISEVKG